MNVKKTIIRIIIIIFAVAASFVGGAFYSGRNIKKLEDRIRESTELIESQESRIINITKRFNGAVEESRELTETIGGLRKEISGLNETIKRYEDRFSKVADGLSTDIEGLSGVIEGIDYYIAEAGDSKKD